MAPFDSHFEPTPEMADQLGLLSIEFSAKYGAFICTACKPRDISEYEARSMYDKDGLIDHLQKAHNFTSEIQLKCVQRLVNRVLYEAGEQQSFEDSSTTSPQVQPEIKVAQGVNFTAFQDTYTESERREILAKLLDHCEPSQLDPLSSDQVQRKLRELSSRDSSRGVFKEARRFHNIHLQAIFQIQHEIVKLEERMSQGDFGGSKKVNRLLIEYAELIEAYQRLTVHKEVHKDGKAFAKFFATELHEPRYWYAPDATERIDLAADSPRNRNDILRKVLQQKLPAIFLDSVGKAMRELDIIEDQAGNGLDGKFGAISKITERYRRHGRYISPSVDNLARIIFALMGGLFLLAPMITLAYITSKTYLIITTSIFILVFAVALGMFSKGSNQELIGATAAYSAVLVVFLGNSIGPKSGN